MLIYIYIFIYIYIYIFIYIYIYIYMQGFPTGGSLTKKLVRFTVT